MSLKARNDVHLARRLWHFGGVMAALALYTVTPPERARAVSMMVCLPIIVLDWIRLRLPYFNRALTRILGGVMREDETQRMAGASYMALGAFIIIWLFPRPVVALALLFLAVADPMASYVGIRYGRDRLVGRKTLQGSLAAFAVCFLISGVFFLTFNLMHERQFIVCLLAALIGAFSELVPVGKLDDNLVFPVLSGALLYGLFFVFGGLT